MNTDEDTQNRCGLYGSESWCTGDCTHCNHYIPRNLYEEIPKDELTPARTMMLRYPL